MKFEDIDKIYFLHLSDRYDRENWMNSQIQKIGFPKDKVNIWWTCRRNISDDIYKNVLFDNLNIGNNVEKHHNSNPHKGGGVFNCAFEHYTMIRTSYERGFNHILIFEDDVKFVVDLNMFKYFISLVPDDYVCCKFFNSDWTEYGKLNCIKETQTVLQEIPTSTSNIVRPFTEFFNDEETDSYKFCSTVAYLLDRNGMKQVIEAYNKNFCIADHIFKYLDYLYICNYQLISTQGYKCPPQDYLWSDLWVLDTFDRFSQFK